MDAQMVLSKGQEALFLLLMVAMPVLLAVLVVLPEPCRPTMRMRKGFLFSNSRPPSPKIGRAHV